MEFQIDGASYRCAKLSVFTQLHVSRKIAGVVPKIVPAMLAASTANGDLTALLTAFEPAAEALAAMSEADVDYVFQHCLAVVQRQQAGGSWANIWNASAKAMQFADIEFGQMTQIVFHVLQDSLSSFIRGFIEKAHATNPQAA